MTAKKKLNGNSNGNGEIKPIPKVKARVAKPKPKGKAKEQLPELDIPMDEVVAAAFEVLDESQPMPPAATPKPKRERKSKPPKPEANGRMKLYGQPVSRALRWMGWKGFTFAQAKAACAGHMGLVPADATIRTKLNDGAKKKDLVRADFDAEQAAELLKFKVKGGGE